MKLLPVLLLNLATVGVALVVYEQLRNDPAPLVVEGNGAEANALAKRIEALETKGRPLLRSQGPDPLVVKRLESLEETVGVIAAPRTAESSSSEEGPPKADRPAPTSSFEPTPAAIARFRRLKDAVDAQDRARKNQARVNRMLDKLVLNINEKQRAKIHTAHAAFEPRVRQIWAEVKEQARETQASGSKVDRAEIISTTMTTIQQEFAQTLDGVVSAPDAQAIAETLHPAKR